MEFKTESKFFHDAVNEYRFCTKYYDDFTILQINEIMMEWHPYVYNEVASCSYSTLKDQQIRQDWFDLFKLYNLEFYILETFSNSKYACVKCVKKLLNVFAITISPELSDYPITLVNCVKKLMVRRCVKNIYGVFEYGRNKHNFHVHFVICFTDRNGRRNMEDTLKKTYKVMKVEQMGGPTHLLKTLRYFHKEDKLNRGIIHNIDLDFFLELAEGEAPIKFTQDINETIYNII